MTSQAAVVELLIEKGRIEPQMAFAIADGIDLAVTQAPFVTVPIFEARLAELRAELRADLRVAFVELDKKIEVTKAELKKEIEATKAELVRWVLLVMLGNVALTTGATAVVNMLQHAH